MLAIPLGGRGVPRRRCGAAGALEVGQLTVPVRYRIATNFPNNLFGKWSFAACYSFLMPECEQALTKCLDASVKQADTRAIERVDRQSA